MPKKATRKDPSALRARSLKVRFSPGIFRVIEKEARVDRRSLGNMIEKLCIEALIARGSFKNTAIT